MRARARTHMESRKCRERLRIRPGCARLAAGADTPATQKIIFSIYKVRTHIRSGEKKMPLSKRALRVHSVCVAALRSFLPRCVHLRSIPSALTVSRRWTIFKRSATRKLEGPNQRRIFETNIFLWDFCLPKFMLIINSQGDYFRKNTLRNATQPNGDGYYLCYLDYNK